MLQTSGSNRSGINYESILFSKDACNLMVFKISPEPFKTVLTLRFSRSISIQSSIPSSRTYSFSITKNDKQIVKIQLKKLLQINLTIETSINPVFVALNNINRFQIKLIRNPKMPIIQKITAKCRIIIFI